MRVVIAGLFHAYKRQRVLDGVDLEFGSGVLGLLGPNGAGKTTLLRLLAGVLRPRTGLIEAGGHNLRTGEGRRDLRHELGYLPQDAALPPDMSPRDFLDYVGLLKGMAEPRERRHQADELIQRLGLALEADRRLGSLSTGTQRRVGVAQALMGQPRLILLDEPTAGLDLEERIRLRAVLGTLGEGRTVVVCTHLLEDVQAVCPEVAVLHMGRVTFSGPAADLTEIAADRAFELMQAPVSGDSGSSSSPLRKRVLADVPPPGARPVLPTMEEGYAALIRDLRRESTAE
ncbi:ATP-binding cassette domain-containing protein [Nocardiopsis sp. L17-MgMaSL7]|uniref:ATP-binding cassette domain-containing protein n=1 Tax=Nocardiopsis sp. L17-MgMaSL7 TaxID=1938893 RepID=UPI000D713EBA|nr:ATP-binding cassette domain-containing protein [Nocardiopsis sp. L17-MgMaSL7]PWV48527.1 ABC-type multidrug transport system ATPase subunit [Nocardiopsis sp. L17-MgMaSL7]